MPQSGPNDPVVESAPNVPTQRTETSEDALRVRILQQELLAELGVRALQGATLMGLLDYAAQITANGLRAEYCKVMEYLPADNRLLVRAGVGWGPDVIGKATIGADLESPAGYALRTGKPVISNQLEHEERFRTPELLARHGVRRAMNVILQGDGSPYGVLEVDSRSEGDFTEHDLTFLQGAANILGMAIEQQESRRKLKLALDRHELLLKEVNHRMKNSLQMVSSMLQLQATAADNPEATRLLRDASNRITTIGRVYDRLAYRADYENVDLAGYLREVVSDLQSTVAPCEIGLDAQEGIEFAGDRAILLALFINEVVLNAAKYAYPHGDGGSIRVSVARSNDDAISVTVRDDGVGIPSKPDPAASARLGARLVEALATQLEARLTRPSNGTGTTVSLLVPLSHKVANKT